MSWLAVTFTTQEINSLILSVGKWELESYGIWEQGKRLLTVPVLINIMKENSCIIPLLLILSLFPL